MSKRAACAGERERIGAGAGRVQHNVCKSQDKLAIVVA